MEKKPTNELDKLLETINPDELGAYLKDNQKYLANGENAFSYYMKDIIAEKGFKLKEVYIQAGVTEKYGSNLLNMYGHTKNRDMIIRLCLAGRFSLAETNTALKLYGMSELYAKEPRDACIIVAIHNRRFDPYEVDELLMERGFEKITANPS